MVIDSADRYQIETLTGPHLAPYQTVDVVVGGVSV